MTHPNYPQQSAGEYADLDGFGQQAQAQHAFALGIETLPDGAYDCEVTSAQLDRAANSDRIVRVNLRLLSAGGQEVQHTYWLNKQASVNGFLAELAALGFPAAQWGSGPGKVPLSAAIPEAVGRLRGVRFRAVKTSRHVPAQPAGMGRAAREAATYHDLRVSGRIQGAPMPGPAQPAAPAAGGGRLAPVGAGAPGDEIPF